MVLEVPQAPPEHHPCWASSGGIGVVLDPPWGGLSPTWHPCVTSVFRPGREIQSKKVVIPAPRRMTLEVPQATPGHPLCQGSSWCLGDVLGQPWRGLPLMYHSCVTSDFRPGIEIFASCQIEVCWIQRQFRPVLGFVLSGMARMGLGKPELA